MTAKAGELVERDGELEALEEALAGADDGRGRLVAIEGAPGMGKTVLLAAARERAAARGLEVLAGRGAVLEREYPFGVARQLLAPLAGGDEEPLREAASGNGPGPALGDATLAALEALQRSLQGIAERGSAILAVDDAHWADAGSLRFLCHLAGRLQSLPVVLVAAWRPREPDARHDLLAHLSTEPGARLLRPAVLSPAAVGTLLAGSGSASDPELAEACHHATGGNPLLVAELVAWLPGGGDATAEELAAEKLGAAAPEGLARTVLRRLQPLPGEALRVAGGLAVLGGRAEPTTVARLIDMDDREVAEAADLLGESDVIGRDRPLEFRHPVVRASVYQELAPSERERMHSRAARLLAAADPSAVDAVAAHLLRAGPAGDGWTAEWLGRAADRALAKGAPDAAVSYLRRAVAEPPPEALRASLLATLGEAEARCGHATEAIETLTEALADTEPLRARVELACRLSQVLILAQRGGEAVTALETAIAGLPGGERELGLELEAELRLATVANPDAARMALGRTPRFQANPRSPRSRGERLALAVSALDEWTKGTAPAAADLSLRALGEGALLQEAGADAPTFAMTAATLYNCGHHAAAERAFSAAIVASRERRSVLGVALSQTCRAEARQRMGMLVEAEEDARAGLEARRLGMRFGIKTGAASLLVALIEQGRIREAQEALAEHGFDGPLPDATTTNYLQRARARLRLEQGDPGRALGDWAECARRDAEHGYKNPILPCWPSSEAPALLALGRTEEALGRAAAEIERARAFRSARELGIALTVHGQTGDDLDSLSEAAEVLAESDARVEQARALAALGGGLRRAGRRRDAREPLRASLRLARAHGATPIAARADEELAATGARPRKILRGGADALTASERRVAALAAGGMTNPEIARELVVSARTVETHLSRAYQKLDIADRRELAAALDGPGGADGGTDG